MTPKPDYPNPQPGDESEVCTAALYAARPVFSVRCDGCKHVDTRDAIALCHGVGWCKQFNQARHLYTLRDCDRRDA